MVDSYKIGLLASLGSMQLTNNNSADGIVVIHPGRFSTYYTSTVVAKLREGIDVNDAMCGPFHNLYEAYRYIQTARPGLETVERSIEVVRDTAITNVLAFRSDALAAGSVAFAESRIDKYARENDKTAASKTGFFTKAGERSRVKEAQRRSPLGPTGGAKRYFISSESLRGPKSGVGGMHVQFGSTSGKTDLQFSPDFKMDINCPRTERHTSSGHNLFTKKFFSSGGSNKSSFIASPRVEPRYTITVSEQILPQADVNISIADINFLFASYLLVISLIYNVSRHYNTVKSENSNYRGYQLSLYGRSI